MMSLSLNLVLVALVWLSPSSQVPDEAGPQTAVQGARPGATSPKDDPKGQLIAGRVIDGLGRPVSGVKATVRSGRPGQDKHTEAVLLTGVDGRYSGKMAPSDNDVDLLFEKDGYSFVLTDLDPGHEDITLKAHHQLGRGLNDALLPWR